MDKQEDVEEEILQGQAEICKHMYGFVDSMALKCVVELGIPDIIHSHGRPITISEIINNIPNVSPSSAGIDYLPRIMLLLARKRVFATHKPDADVTETRYGLTPSSKFLLKDSDFNLAPLVLIENHSYLMDPWHYLGKCIQEGGSAFDKSHGSEIWKFGSENSQFNKLFCAGMACMAKTTLHAILVKYQDGFNGLETIVDVGGGTGMMLSGIVKKNPHLKGINFDLPHVVKEAPSYFGVTHVGGDMFVEIPRADAVFLKLILHDWNDQDCVRILKNCKTAIPKNGKLIIIDCVLNPNGEGLYDDLGVAFDLAMRVFTSGGKERSEAEWKILLEDGGFPRYKIIRIPTIPSLIEAYPE